MASTFPLSVFLLKPMKSTVITNNPLVNNKVDGAVYNCEASLTDILTIVRDKVHLGHRLLTHPLSGSVKPGQTPYKSVVISSECEETADYKSLTLIEDALAMAHTMTSCAGAKAWSERILSDFQLIDYSLIADIIE